MWEFKNTDKYSSAVNADFRVDAEKSNKFPSYVHYLNFHSSLIPVSPIKFS